KRQICFFASRPAGPRTVVRDKDLSGDTLPIEFRSFLRPLLVGGGTAENENCIGLFERFFNDKALSKARCQQRPEANQNQCYEKKYHPPFHLCGFASLRLCVEIIRRSSSIFAFQLSCFTPSLTCSRGLDSASAASICFIKSS